jgi:hypothetical protein
MGAKLKSKTHLQNMFFWFFEPFLRIWLQSFQNVLFWQKKYFFKSKRYQKRRISRNFISKTSLTNMSIKVKIVHISITFLLITFFGCIFSKLFQRIRNQREILRFLISILNFCSFSTFCNLSLQIRKKWLKKAENLFYECVLEFNYATIKGFA